MRLADVGPVAVGFWRLFLALPLLAVLGIAVGQKPVWPRKLIAGAILLSAIFYVSDLAMWNIGIRMTKLANATLFGNCASFAFVAWGLWLARKWPTGLQSAALALAAVGCGLLVAGSAELSARNVRGDILALLAGILYAGYLIFVERARTALKPLQVLFLATLFGSVFLLPISLALGERVMPQDWTPLLIIAVSSQVVGQGLLVYAIGTLPSVVVGLALLTQPAIAAMIGWFFYGERLSVLDWAGAVAIAAALVLVQLRAPALRSGPEQPNLAP
ncbi:DMT family transporter [Sphingomonas piscis]|uniref:DMT family transporter n=1 Tax=Sphingomonas piscis TaxID=2714943 RepID=UPI001FE3F013|nr:DMT family transporter [Sphingomonas piscis]